MREQELLDIINRIRTRNEQPPLGELDASASLRDDLGFSSFDLAELTVRIEDAYQVDIFETGLVRSLGEVIDRISATVN